MQILLKVIARQFYSQNSGLFLLILFFGFGFLSGKEHIAIAVAVADNPFLTTGIIMIWGIYSWFTYHFTNNVLSSLENIFLRNLSFFPRNGQIVILSIIQMTLNVPVIVYSMFVATYTIKYEQWINLFFILIYLVVANILPVIFYRKALYQPIKIVEENRINTWLNQNFSKPIWLWPIIQIFRLRPFLYLCSKVLSITVLVAFFTIDDPELYDWRWLSIGMLLITSINIILIYEFFRFHKYAISWTGNMPFPLFLKLVQHTIGIVLLILPEVLLTLKYYPEDRSLLLLMQLLVYKLTLCVSFFSYLYFSSSSIELSMQKYFYIFIFIFVILLFGFPLLFQTILLLLFLLIVHMNYYRINPS